MHVALRITQPDPTEQAPCQTQGAPHPSKSTKSRCERRERGLSRHLKSTLTALPGCHQQLALLLPAQGRWLGSVRAGQHRQELRSNPCKFAVPHLGAHASLSSPALHTLEMPGIPLEPSGEKKGLCLDPSGLQHPQAIGDHIHKHLPGAHSSVGHDLMRSASYSEC